MSKRVIVQLEEGVWLTRGDGDPPRTLVKESAHQFMSRAEARRGLKRAREFRPFKKAEFEISDTH